jgi:hypothetical protein
MLDGSWQASQAERDRLMSGTLSGTSVQVQQKLMLERRAERLGVTLSSLGFNERNAPTNETIEPEPILQRQQPAISNQQQDARDKLSSIHFDFDKRSANYLLAQIKRGSP